MWWWMNMKVCAWFFHIHPWTVPTSIWETTAIVQCKDLYITLESYFPQSFFNSERLFVPTWCSKQQWMLAIDCCPMRAAESKEEIVDLRVWCTFRFEHIAVLLQLFDSRFVVMRHIFWFYTKQAVKRLKFSDVVKWDLPLRCRYHPLSLHYWSYLLEGYCTR